MAFLRRKTEEAPPPVITVINGIKPHDALCLRAEKFLRSNGFSVAFSDRFQAGVATGEKPDALGFRNGASCLVEVKCSRSDFLTDRKKHFRMTPEFGMGDWRFFMSEPGIISVSDLPEGWGLLHVVGRSVIKVHGWPANTMWLDHKPFKANKQAECDFLYSALRRINMLSKSEQGNHEN